MIDLATNEYIADALFLSGSWASCFCRQEASRLQADQCSNYMEARCRAPSLIFTTP